MEKTIMNNGRELVSDSDYLRMIKEAIASNGMYRGSNAGDIAELAANIVAHRYMISTFGIDYIGGINLVEE